jgi:phage terminase small subunit
MASTLTLKQEAFAMAYVENGGNASEAYRIAYDVREGTKPETIWQAACRILNDSKVAARVEELKQDLREKHKVTVEALILELEEARQAALQAETPQTSAAVSATMGKAKLAGLDKQVVEMTGSIQHGVTVSVSFEK